MKITYFPAECRSFVKTENINSSIVKLTEPSKKEPGHDPGIVEKDKRKRHATT
jgi:hypothetical protein